MSESARPAAASRPLVPAWQRDGVVVRPLPLFFRFFVSSWMFLLPDFAMAQTGRTRPPDDAQRYDACMTLTRRDAMAAFEQALNWQDQGGGAPAKHCAAAALVSMKQFKEGAARLEALAQEIKQPEMEPVRIGVLAQAGQAWLLAGDTGRAFAAQSAALQLAPQDPEIWIDRGQTLATAKNYKEAIEDFDKAIAIDPERADAYMFRASARRYMEDLARARQDIDKALKLAPTDPDAMVERGIIKRLTNDDAGAREDWMQVIRRFPDSAASAAAQTNLEKLDVKQ
ncbi:MAG: tetratricopeptide repeat protein [Alphaproteobacteria bacterium]|nr:tetratricopeptide repeat protein [Alphaproteobacteria bacterium]